MATTRKLKIVKLDEKTRGQGKYGEWILHEVTADDEHGNRIDKKLITFKGDKLPLNELIEVEVEKKEKEGYPDSYNISPLNPNKPPSRDEFKALAQQVLELSEEVENLKSGSKNSSQPAREPQTATEDDADDVSQIPF